MKRLWGFGLIVAAVAVSACQPITSDTGSTVPVAPATATAPTVLMLPDGAECSWAGGGESMEFDGKSVTYVCNILNTVLVGDPVQIDDIHWTVTEGTLAPGASSTDLAESHEVTFLLAELQLADGSSCFNAGLGATFAVDGERVNWTCGERPNLTEYVVAGPLTLVGADAPGIYVANKAHVVEGSDGFTADNTVTVSVSRITGAQDAVSSMPGENGGGLPPGPADPTTIVLPDGDTCLWSGEGATVAFDGVRANYHCTTPDSVLLGDPVMVEDAVWTVTKGMIASGTAGFELVSSEEITFQLNELDLVDGSTCLNAGRGATMGFEEGRLNWTCGEDAQDQYGVFGPLQNEEGDAPGAYYAIKILFTQDSTGFTKQTTFRVPVVTIIGGDVQLTPGEMAMQTPEGGSVYASPAGFTVTLPASWQQNMTIEELTGEDAQAFHPLAQSLTRFTYTPVDSTYAPQSLLNIYVFTAEDWATVDTTSGPPVGSEVGQGDGVVYVASTPQSNPYPEGTEDFTNFNAMAQSIGDVVASIE